jgi:hypothetical protein
LIANSSSGTLVNTPRRSLSVVTSQKHSSALFSHDAEPGVECMLHRVCLACQSGTGR